MHTLLARLIAGHTLDEAEAADAFEQIMTGQSTPAQTAALLALIEQRGANVDELVGAAQVMRDKVAMVEVPQHLRVIDTCGTGGDHTPTFNVSTTAAIVAAAVARPRNIAVAKHGNKTVTRSSGSSQGLEALGVKLLVSPQTLTKCLDEAGICFCFAPAHHPAMKHAMPVRMELGFRTIFNLLGPLTNPAGADAQLMGVFETGLLEPLARTLDRLGARRALLVHGYKDASRNGGFCELSTTGPSVVTELTQGDLQTYEVDPQSLGLKTAKLDDLLVDSPATSAAVIERILNGEDGPPRDIVLLNAAAALRVADLADDLEVGLELAAQAIDSGNARQTLDGLIKITQADPT